MTALALPLVAAVTLQASSIEMGILAAVGQVPFLLFSLPAGAWIDRRPRRPVLIATDVASCLLLLSIPMAVLFGGPSYPQLCLVAFAVGTMSVLSEVAHYAYVPSLVGRDRLTESNSKLQLSYSVSAAAGPGLAGVLVQLLSAPVAVAADALTFLLSALLLRSIRHEEARPEEWASGVPLRTAIAGGLRILVTHRLLRPVLLASVPISFFTSGFVAIYLLYAARDLELAPSTIGLIFAGGGVGAVLGALVAGRAADRFGVGRVIVGGWLVAGASALLVPLAAGSAMVIIALLTASRALEGLAGTVANIHQWSLRQAVTPDDFAGRVTAAHRFAVYGAAAVGAVAAGALGEILGLRSALFVCGVGALVSPLAALFSPLSALRRQPLAPDATGCSVVAPAPFDGGRSDE